MSNTSQEQQLQTRIKELEAEISSLKKRKKYGLVWEDKPEDVVAQCETHVPVLSEVKGKKISDKNQPSENIIIEGDNYHALSVLSYTHRNAIDVIYIDPPYNTGARDWKYNNDYVDSEDSYRHSKWISFMKKRLSLARNLLSDNGFVACAIDHYELFTLGSLMDEVFGENNRIGVVTVVHKPEGRQFANFLSPSNEFMLLYAKNKSQASFRDVVLDEEKAKEFNLVDEHGNYKLKNFIRLTDGKYSLRENKPAGFYPIYVSKDLQEFSLKERPGFLKALPITERGVERVWKTFGETFMKKVKDNSIIAKQEDGRIVLYEKLRPSQVFVTHWTKKEYHGYHFGTKILENILGPKKFDFPKSLFLIKDVLSLTARKNATILDFFAGSGTTGHAVLELNKEDGGNRQFILCTNNENKIAEEVTYPRVKKVIQGYGDTEGLGGALRYYKTKLVDIEKLQKIPDERRLKLTYQAGEMIALRENTLDETEKNEWWQIFENNNKTVAIYFQEDKQKLRDLVKKIDSNEQVVLYVFSWGKNEYKNEFAEYQNIRVEDIPEPIIEVYKEINRLK